MRKVLARALFMALAALVGLAAGRSVTLWWLDSAKTGQFDVTVGGAPWSPKRGPAIPNDDPGRDDAPAIQAAIDHAQKQGGTVFIPAGVYQLKSALVVTRGPLCIQGQGDGTRLVVAENKGLSAALSLRRASPSDPYLFGVRILNLSLQTEGAGRPRRGSRSLVGIQLQGAKQCTLEQVGLHGFQTGLLLEGGSNGNRLEDVRASRCRRGLWIRGGAAGEPAAHNPGNFFSQCRMEGLPPQSNVGRLDMEEGIRIDGESVGDQFFFDCWVTYARTGVWIQKGGDPAGYHQNLQFSNLMVDWSVNHALFCRGVDNLRLEGGYLATLYGAGIASGVEIVDADRAILNGVFILGRTQQGRDVGVTLRRVRHATVQGCIVERFGTGILLEDTVACAVSGNSLFRLGINGVHLWGLSPGSGRQNTINGNTISLLKWDGAARHAACLEEGPFADWNRVEANTTEGAPIILGGRHSRSR